MADAVTSNLIFNGNRHAAFVFTNDGGTVENGVTKIDATSDGSLGVVLQGQTFYPGVHMKITKVRYSVQGMALRIQWHATSNQDALILAGADHLDFTDTGGIQNPGTAALTGATGSIDFTTDITTPGSGVAQPSYFVEIEVTKGIPQS